MKVRGANNAALFGDAYRFNNSKINRLEYLLMVVIAYLPASSLGIFVVDRLCTQNILMPTSLYLIIA